MKKCQFLPTFVGYHQYIDFCKENNLTPSQSRFLMDLVDLMLPFVYFDDKKTMGILELHGKPLSIKQIYVLLGGRIKKSKIKSYFNLFIDLKILVLDGEFYTCPLFYTKKEFYIN